MGGAISGAFKSITSGLGSIGSSIIKSVAPGAINMLKNVVGSGFDSLTNIAKSFVGQLPLVGPLASGLIDKVAPGLKNMVTGGVESLLTKLTNSITERLAPGTGGQTLALPSIFQRFQEIIKQSTGAASSSGAAATTSSGSAASTSSSSGSSGSSSASSAGWSGGPPDSANYKMDDPGGVAKFNADFQKYQMAMNTVQEAGKRASDLEKARHDALMGLIANIK